MKRILVIDDTPEVCGLIGDMLSFGNYQVITASNGLQGAKLAESEAPDLILCDLHMPELDGIGTLQRLRESPSTAAIPFLFLTGDREHPRLQQGLEMGAAGSVAKPFTVRELLETVRACLGGNS